MPLSYNRYEYYRRTVEGLSYAIHCRRPRGSTAGVEQVHTHAYVVFYICIYTYNLYLYLSIYL